MTFVRFCAISATLHLKMLARSSLMIFVSIVSPVFLATAAYFLFRSGERAELVFDMAVGAGLMGVWAATLFGCSGLVDWQRWQGTLEPLVGSPRSLAVILAPLTLVTSAFGLVSISATVLWARLVLGVPVEVARPGSFVAAIAVTVVSLGFLGLLLAIVSVLYRHANALANLLGQPVWLITGMWVPVSLLPGWVEPLSWTLSPTWGTRAVQDAIHGASPWRDLFFTCVCGTAYLVFAVASVRHFERLARVRATVSLV